jgi:poly(A) polymerase
MRLEAEWLRSAHLRAVLDALDNGAFFVGGCVRNTLLGQPVADIDITTPIEPDEVARRLEAAGLRAVPTGIEHGTVMAVSGGEGFEITTFRADVATDGRRATVRFSTDIAEDAARRDFTMNAIYADAEGEIIDPLGGLPDLEARRVRFIGDPHDRIREDYLRILRFFRFTAWYGAEGIEPEGLAACTELADGIEGGRARSGPSRGGDGRLGGADALPARGGPGAAGAAGPSGGRGRGRRRLDHPFGSTRWREPGPGAPVEPGRSQGLGQYPRVAGHAGSGCHRRSFHRPPRGAGYGADAGRERG